MTPALRPRRRGLTLWAAAALERLELWYWSVWGWRCYRRGRVVLWVRGYDDATAEEWLDSFKEVDDDVYLSLERIES